MSLNGRFKLEILDLENTSGNPQLEWVFTEGTTSYLGYMETDYEIGFRNAGQAYSVPVLMRGRGTGTIQHPTPIANPRMEMEINGEPIIINDWAESPKAARMTAYGLAPSIATEPADIRNPYYGKQKVKLLGETIGHVPNPVYYQRGRVDIMRLYQKEFRSVQNYYSGFSDAWLSYDLTSGMNNSRMFAYSFEILQRISGLSGTELVPDKHQGPALKYYSGVNYSGRCDVVSLLLDTTGTYCESPDEFSVPVTVCVKSGLSPAEVQSQISSIVNATTRAEQERGTIKGDFVDDSEVITDPLSLSYSIYEGVIAYNYPISGDYFCFSPYSYDYSGQYMEKYGVVPPHPQQDFCWSYPQDFTGIDQLVTKINNTLSGSGYNIWIQDGCVDTSLSGYYESGNLLTATRSGANEIYIQSTRTGPAGKYKFTFFENDRTGLKPYNNSVKYMMPRKISVEAGNAYGVWATIDVKSGIDWNAVSPVIVPTFLDTFSTGFPTGTNGAPIPEPTSNTPVASGRPVGRVLYQAQISGKNKCGQPFFKDVDFIEVPSGYSCESTGDDEFIRIDEDAEKTGYSPDRQPVNYFFLKSGWKFSNPNSYRYYRFKLEDFFVDDQGTDLALSNTFYINNINMYGVVTGAGTHSGVTCLQGSAYSGQIMGYTSGIISGVLTGEADKFGKLCYDRYIVSGVPNSNGRVKFQRTFGQAVEMFTGLVNACVTGTGYYTEMVGGYYAGNNCVEFAKPVSGYITGSGHLYGGPYAIIRDEVVPDLTGFQNVTGSAKALLTGTIPNFRYTFTDIPSFMNATGRVSGVVNLSDNGSIRITEVIERSTGPSQSILISGTKEASSNLSYNSPVSGDTILINGAPIVYSPNALETAPTYFKNVSELVNIINSGSDVYGVSGVQSGSGIHLSSIYPGITGNGISVISMGSVSRPAFDSSTLTGGTNYYFPTTPASNFTGLLDVTLTASGMYSGLASGFMTGQIKQLDFIRYFTGIWDITSGDIDFRTNHWVTENGSVYQNSGFSEIPNYSGHPDIIPLIITYVNNPLVLSNDLATLIVTGYGTNQSVTMTLSGHI